MPANDHPQHLGKTHIGVDIGGTKTAIVLSSAPPAILARIDFPALPIQGPARALALIQHSIHELLDRFHIDPAHLAAIGVSCGGPLDRIGGIIQAPPNLPTWTDVPITSTLEHAFKVPCKLENDANAGAVAEFRYGAGRGTRHMVFLTMGTGIGAGLILDGRLYHGAADLAGEIGHVRLTPSGPLGHNKAGSVEGWASGGGMAAVAQQEVAAAISRGETTLLADSLHTRGTLTARDIAQAAQQGDPLAQRLISQTGQKLGEALAILVDILNPERIVIGGMALRLGETLLAPARAALHREALRASAALCEIVPAALGEQIGDIASLCVATGL
jgi:glucokinase